MFRLPNKRWIRATAVFYAKRTYVFCSQCRLWSKQRSYGETQWEYASSRHVLISVTHSTVALYHLHSCWPCIIWSYLMAKHYQNNFQFTICFWSFLPSHFACALMTNTSKSNGPWYFKIFRLKMRSLSKILSRRSQTVSSSRFNSAAAQVNF